jgi:hypothetical protein
MKTENEIKANIKAIEQDYQHVLTGSLATIDINAPRALEQIAAESKLKALHWTLGTEYKTKLKGVDR